MIEVSASDHYRRRVLLCSVGLTPQVATETLHALALGRGWRPTELIVLTTTAGASLCRSLLLGDGGALAAWARDWCAPWAQVLASEARIEIVETDSGDIDAPRSAALFADHASRLVRTLAEDPEAALHVSLAGGRKPSAAALAVAMTLWARPQDSLSHVLVDTRFAAHPSVFYPAPRPQLLLGRDGETLDAAEARVELVDIPFPQLRRFALGADGDMATVIAATQDAIDRRRLRISPRDRRLDWDGAPLKWPAAAAAWLAWLAHDLVSGGLGLPRVGASRRAWLTAYGAFAEPRVSAAAARRLPDPLDSEWMEEKASRVAKLAADCGAAPRGSKLVLRIGKRAALRYRLALDPHEVEWVGDPLGHVA